MTIGIVGLGLIGGSIGLALREPDRKIMGYDPNPDAVRVAGDRFCIDTVGTLEEVSQADVVFLAVPPIHVVSALEAVRKAKRPETVVTDCTSAKNAMADWVMKIKDPTVVIGHPMAGHENSGAKYASAWMFRGAKWILCPVSFTDKQAVRQVESLIKAMGASPVRMPPELHDRQIATLSHLPHAIAGALVQMQEDLAAEDVSGGSWRDLTRVGGVDPNLWTQIFIENRIELARAIGDLESRLGTLKTALETNDDKTVRSFFDRAKKAKKAFEIK